MNATQTYRANQVLSLNAWRLRYDAMVAAAMGGSARARRQAAALFDLLHDRRFAVHQSLESLAVGGETGLVAAQERVDTAWAELQAATEEVSARLDLLLLIQERERARSQQRAAARGHDMSLVPGDRDLARARTRARAGVAQTEGIALKPGKPGLPHRI